MTFKPRPIMERINEKIDIDPDTDCWIWSGAVAGPGRKHGVVRIPGNKLVYVHRYLWESEGRPLPEKPNLLIRQCGTPRCCNPDHFKPGEPGELRRKTTLAFA